MKKRALFVLSSGLVNGGVPGVTLQIVDSFCNDYVFDVLVTGLAQAVYDEKFLSYGGKIYKIPKVSYKKNRLSIIVNGGNVYRKVLELCKLNRYDVIHCENGFESGPALRAASKAGIPIRIAHAHGTYLIKGKNLIANIYKYICKKEISKYSTVKVACSKKAGDSLFFNQYINVLNPIDTDYYLGIIKQIHDGINLLQIGYYCKLKNQLFSLKVLRELVNNSENAKLYFMGFETESGYLDKMKLFVKDNGLERNVFFLDPQTPKSEIMPIIDFLLLPSTSEGLPLTVLEAQSSNIMAVVSNVVSCEVDLGLCKFNSINDPKQWVNTIIDNYGYKQTVDSSRLLHFSKTNYMLTIKNLYDGNRSM